MLRILYLGSDALDSTSLHRANALRRLGHDVLHLNPSARLPRNRWVTSFNVRTGYRFAAPFCGRQILRQLGERRFDVCWVDQGGEIPPWLYGRLKATGARIVNYNLDDPFGSRDGRKWDLYRRGVRWHDVTVVVRDENVAEAKAFGARHVVRVFRSYDPVEHSSEGISAARLAELSCEVLFLGTWMPERGPFLSRLVQLGVPLTIQGGAWQRASEPEIARCWRGGALYNRDYVAAVKAAPICLGLLSKGNRDLHTQRSAEIPFIGSLFCCERTTDHQQLFRDGESAVMWSTPEECAAACRELIADPVRRQRIADSGRNRVIDLELSNEGVFRSVLASLDVGGSRP